MDVFGGQVHITQIEGVGWIQKHLENYSVATRSVFALYDTL